jgi:hypothetical protein
LIVYGIEPTIDLCYKMLDGNVKKEAHDILGEVILPFPVPELTRALMPPEVCESLRQ